MSLDKKQPWWEKLPPSAGGDVIVGVVGANARGVAVGKQIQQNVDSSLGPMTHADEATIEQRLAELEKAVQAALPKLDPGRAARAPDQLAALKDELTKTGDGEVPSGTAIVRVGNWLLDNIPDIAGAVTGLFTTPAVGKIVGKAGDVAVDWARNRFGQTEPAS
ncbi:MAG TPA: hypothetical protein VKT80_00150 [Chloroflexota bacterium]|nr:hypothetical protein [Chloroflexota bacterium]